MKQQIRWDMVKMLPLLFIALLLCVGCYQKVHRLPMYEQAVQTNKKIDRPKIFNANVVDAIDTAMVPFAVIETDTSTDSNM